MHDILGGAKHATHNVINMRCKWHKYGSCGTWNTSVNCMVHVALIQSHGACSTRVSILYGACGTTSDCVIYLGSESGVKCVSVVL